LLIGKMVRTKEVSDLICRIFIRSPHCMTPEEQLWRSVAARAVLDAVGKPGVSDPDKWNKAVKEARLWFRYSDDDHTLQTVFDLARVELSTVRKEVLKAPVRYYEKRRVGGQWRYFKE